MGAGSKRLRTRVVRRPRLDDETREAMWRLYAEYYEGVTRETFLADLQDKTHVIVLFAHHRVVGFSTLTTYIHRHDGRRHRILFSGDTIVEAAYWGDRSLQHAFGRFMTLYRLRFPFTPMYWFLITKGYKTYLLLTRNFPEHWPRHDRETPPGAAGLIAGLGRARFGPLWDAERGIVRAGQEGPRLRVGIAPVPSGVLPPDIHHFVQRNPHHHRGEELACIGRITLGLWFRYAWRKMFRARDVRTTRRRAPVPEEAG